MPTTTPLEVLRKIPTVFLLDVRQPEEYQQWHIPEAVNIPLAQLSKTLDCIPTDKEIITICAHGIRSAKAAAFLQSQGYNAKSMEGGMVMWNSVYDVVVVSSEVEILQVKRVGKGCLSYIVIHNGEAAVIDPTIDFKTHLEILEQKKVKLVAVLETHLQADHVSGARELAALTQSAYYLHPENEIKMEEMIIKPLSASGHTPESVVYLLGDFAFTGDTLFVDSIGRPDLGEDIEKQAQQLWTSLEMLRKLPLTTIILPAHYHGQVDLGKAVSSQLKDLHWPTAEDFAARIKKNIPEKPAAYDLIIRVNKVELTLDETQIRELEAGENKCAMNSSNT